MIYYLGLFIVVAGLPLGFYDITLPKPPVIFILIPVILMIGGLTFSVVTLYRPLFSDVQSNRGMEK